MEAYSDSGLLAMTVPRAYGGADVSAVTLAEVIAIISAADGSLGQIPQSHFYMVEALRLDAPDEMKRFFFERVLERRAARQRALRDRRQARRRLQDLCPARG